jgi:small subunit ribosomal protein S1
LTTEEMGGTQLAEEASASPEPTAETIASDVADEPTAMTDGASDPSAAASAPEESAEVSAAAGGEAAGQDGVVAQADGATADATPQAPEGAATIAEGAAEEPSPTGAPSTDADGTATPSPAAEVASPEADSPTAQTETPAATTDEAGGAATSGEGEAAATSTSDADAPAETPEPAPAPARDLGPEPQTMEELLAEQEGDIRSLKHGDVVEGTVVRIDKDEILVDIGAKSEGVVSNRELYGRHAEAQPVLNLGDTVLVYVLQPESEQGHAVLSLRRAGLERKWRAMQELFDAGTIIEAPVIDHNKGGLIVDCGIRGFVPISQIVDFPRRPQNDQPRDAAQEIAEKLQPFVGRKLRLKILEVNRKANRLILSEKVALYEERREKRDELFSSLQVGQRVTGSVRSIAPFGVFVDLGGIDGLVHKSELSWNKVNNPEAGYKVGDEVEAEVIDINHERGRISLSIRRLQPDPWNSTVADFKTGDIIEGTVTKIVNFGAFVRVRDGLEGLIHISELSHQRVAHPGDVVHEGQRLKLKIISLDSERHRLGLSLKQAEEPPARPSTESRPRRERGGDRGYDMSQAVQEPEGGIDNTLAAAFAQVRQQMAESASTPAAEATTEAEATTAASPAASSDEPEATESAVATETAEAEADAVAEAEIAADAEVAAVAAPAEETPGSAEEASPPSEETAASDATAEAETEAATGEASAEAEVEAASAEAGSEAEAVGETPVSDAATSEPAPTSEPES